MWILAVNKLPFTDVPLKDNDETSINVKKEKKVKRIVHFSDGVLEEYSSDEENENVEKKKFIDPKTLAWLPYIWFHMSTLGTRTLSVCDYFGERLAWFLGITSPKYQYELDEAKRMAEEEEKQKKMEDEEYAGWKTKSSDDPISTIQHSQPKVSYDEEINRDLHLRSVSSITESNSSMQQIPSAKPAEVHDPESLSAEKLVDPKLFQFTPNKLYETVGDESVGDNNSLKEPTNIEKSTEENQKSPTLEQDATVANLTKDIEGMPKVEQQKDTPAKRDLDSDVNTVANLTKDIEEMPKVEQQKDTQAKRDLDSGVNTTAKKEECEKEQNVDDDLDASAVTEKIMKEVEQIVEEDEEFDIELDDEEEQEELEDEVEEDVDEGVDEEGVETEEEEEEEEVEVEVVEYEEEDEEDEIAELKNEGNGNKSTSDKRIENVKSSKVEPEISTKEDSKEIVSNTATSKAEVNLKI